MPDHTAPNRKRNVNTEVSEYMWDIKTKRYKRNPDYRPGDNVASYIFWTIAVLILVIAIIWCLRA